MALYRTYRPLAFVDVVGQDHIVTTLEQAVMQDKLSHAYLFAGSRGTGKTSVARILAKHIMTHGIPDGPLKQQIIKGIEEGSLVDLLEIDAASNRSIDDVRDLIEKIQFSPVVAAAKVYIIDEAHMLTKDAFNALLKTLEEPPEYAHFILATTELHKIPSTIQSRCQTFPFRPIEEEDIVRRLQYIADQEHITVDREALRLVARHVEGGLRDAISLLDQMRSLPKITVQDVEQRIGVSGHEHIERVVDAIQRNDPPALLDAVQALEEAGVPLDLFLRSLLTLIRSELHHAIAEKKPITEHMHALDILLEAVRDLRLAPVPGLVVEAALLALCAPAGKERGRAEILPAKAAEKVEKKKSKEEETAAAQAPKKEEESALSGAEIEAPEVTLETMTASWEQIVEETAPASVRMSLKNGELQTVAGLKVTVGFTSAFHRDKVAATDASRTVEEIMHKIFRRSLKLECVLEKDREKDGTKENVVNLADAAAEVF
ncbi:MAG TPA: DNA polymerase III subunit gamma/tau [Candidatus Peribacter riflensis]|uniref:DNA polymerase III subunit gamma/tau n=1 Tax=Candidatus Peribacter riflensis TaxID=1735162 RepID=A0A0S1SBZ1_9BACT|nr:MAG: putative DNA polymerase III subunit gamma /tau [Candidatus Peribacter riflensis]OGJ80211.1 MAG: DNA polymerase III, subunit gamma and tau [Candidatus Peribacteria bacterium RIFOXYC1_FULL_58_8]ALM11176.1 MAG: putative DNA polymerase III subunit gamma /tau [Candidatus Peribacter riflensis]ALM12279.1 MAG: DNA polymerase III subunit gamma/tau [Candidatus Peribacter riflensis]ALM13381.1 MAG: DNA polymerase III subunit gamma/tau [Candidatus Peribacter riflensis]